MSPIWRIMLLASVAAIASEPALAGNYGGGFIEFVMTGGQQAAPQRDPFAQPRATAPVPTPGTRSAPVLYAAPPAQRRWLASTRWPTVRSMVCTELVRL